MSRPTVAYQGQPGAFAHAASLAYVPDHEPIACATFADVIAAVREGEADLGILPVENNAAGQVEDAVALLAQSGLRTVSEHEMPIRMHLLGVPGATLAGIRTAISHPIALAQCRETLRALRLPSEAATNTAEAARMLSTTRDMQTAVLASEAAAHAYGLTILRRNMHDRPDNTTLFRVVAREDEPA